MNKRLAPCLAMLMLLGVECSHGQKSNEVLTATGVRFPQYDTNGVMSSQMFGSTARVMPNGYVEVTELRMEFYDQVDGTNQVDMTVTSPRCLYNRNRGAAVSDSDVRIAKDNMVVTGTGFLWNNHEQMLKIMSKSKVVLRNVRKQMKEEPEP